MKMPPLLLLAARFAFVLAIPFGYSAPAGAQTTEPPSASRSSSDADVRTRELGTITVIGRRPTSLPTQIPTTIEGITGAEIEVQINATDSEDALKYFPSLNVRKRYIGDYDHAVLQSRASGTNNSARSLVYADGILLSNLLGNGAAFTPRWGLVTPEEIERVDVLYGPFSAAYSGNSVGAVVDYVTRMPSELEVRASVTGFAEDFHVYRSQGDFSGRQASASVGDRHGNFSWWLNWNRLESDAHPIVFPNRLLSAGVIGTAGTPVTGVLDALSPRDQPWIVLGATSFTHTIQDHEKLKIAYDFTDVLRLSYTLGVWDNAAQRGSETYLRDAAGNPVWNGTINYGGRSYALAAADFAPTTGDLRHLIQGLSLKSSRNAGWNYEIAASRYDYDHDIARSPTVTMPAALTGGAGRITDQHGTGWGSLALKLIWRPSDNDKHVVDLGLQNDAYDLRTLVSNTTDWLHGDAATRFSAFRGDSVLTSLYAQDTWGFAPGWRSTLGLRVEHWRAHDGALSDATSTLTFGEREDTWLSPKAAIARQLSPQWSLKASVGRAIRLPTVAELYQGTISTTTIVNNDPNLKPERSWTSELSAERALRIGSLRMTMFLERTLDALYSQTNVTVSPAVTNIQNVDRIGTKGIEVAFASTALLGGRLDLNTSATFARSLIEANANFPDSIGKWQPRVPRWRWTGIATYRMGSQWSVSMGGRYSSKQFNTLDNGDPNGYAYTGTSPYLVFDARARYENAHFSASIGIDNLGDEEYWAFHPYTRRMLMADLGVRF
ncbi:MAG: TonB-dependent receptor [Gammaproteobacteria bacterium]